MIDPPSHPEIPTSDERAAFNAALFATGTETSTNGVPKPVNAPPMNPADSPSERLKSLAIGFDASGGRVAKVGE
jgi:hypothetical protein